MVVQLNSRVLGSAAWVGEREGGEEGRFCVCVWWLEVSTHAHEVSCFCFSDFHVSFVFFIFGENMLKSPHNGHSGSCSLWPSHLLIVPCPNILDKQLTLSRGEAKEFLLPLNLVLGGNS